MSWEFGFFAALFASFFFYSINHDRIQLCFLIISSWLSLLFVSKLKQAAGLFDFLGEREILLVSGAFFVVAIGAINWLFGTIFIRARSESVWWWQALLVAFVEAGLLVAGLFGIFRAASFITFSENAQMIFGSETAFLVWLFLPLVGMIALGKKQKRQPKHNTPP